MKLNGMSASNCSSEWAMKRLVAGILSFVSRELRGSIDKTKKWNGGWGRRIETNRNDITSCMTISYFIFLLNSTFHNRLNIQFVTFLLFWIELMKWMRSGKYIIMQDENVKCQKENVPTKRKAKRVWKLVTGERYQPHPYPNWSCLLSGMLVRMESPSPTNYALKPNALFVHSDSDRLMT